MEKYDSNKRNRNNIYCHLLVIIIKLHIILFLYLVERAIFKSISIIRGKRKENSLNHTMISTGERSGGGNGGDSPREVFCWFWGAAPNGIRS